MEMAIVTGFSRFSEVATYPAFIGMPSSSMGIAFWTLSMALTAWLADPVRVLLLEDEIVVITIAIPIGLARPASFAVHLMIPSLRLMAST